MPSNKQLNEKIHALNPEADTEGLTNAQLKAMLAELEAAAEAADSEPAADPEPPAAEPATVAEPAEGFAYTVADGKAITTKRGVLSEGAGVNVDDLAGGKGAASSLADAGLLVKN